MSARLRPSIYGTDDQKERWLKAENGALLGTYSTSERATGGHWWYNLSKASRDGGEYLLDGKKSFTTSSGQADLYAVQTRAPAVGPSRHCLLHRGRQISHETKTWNALKPKRQILIPLREFKVHGAEVTNQVAAAALTVTGGYGYHRGPSERSFRGSRAATAWGRLTSSLGTGLANRWSAAA
ncbi:MULTISPECIES: hypothetical protein [unclassified Bradyrhizobium]|uniref:hypothetical protein n=1 Tax=unclassified Bradyrhizobium TaxID=2631580 RepID=UPI0020B33752|nr:MULTISPECIES: hypothetical protein [unclassified Bradyrhizobium]MCP3396954.1 hypothetical protein [Bradyrhizobium sp. CCGB20]MCP3405469.1 hypothetical protein [Bradyrhizobium sp. CCGB01]